MLMWRAIWRIILGPRQQLIAEWSDGKTLPVGFFDSWWLRRPPHLLVRVTFNGETVWQRRP
jgi:hypothetical protein